VRALEGRGFASHVHVLAGAVKVHVTCMQVKWNYLSEVVNSSELWSLINILMALMAWFHLSATFVRETETE